MKTITKLLAVALSLIITFASINVMSILAVDRADNTIDSYENLNKESGNIYNKIHFCLDNDEYDIIDDAEELTEATEYLISVDQTKHLNEISSVTENEIFDDIHMIVEFESSFHQTDEFINLSKERNNITSHEDVLDYRIRLNTYSKQYHRDLIEQNMDILSKQERSSVEVIDYSPFVVLRMNTDNVDPLTLTYVCESDNIENIYISFEPNINDYYETNPIMPSASQAVASWEATLKCVNAYNIISNGTYTGRLINIGVCESGGVCDTKNKNLAGKNITVKPNNDPDDHADAVTSIIALMAPAANIYVGSAKGDIYNYLSWFLDNYCDIINCSFSYYDDNYKSYTYFDAIFDYLINTHNISIIKSSGNVSSSPDAKITSPSYAYNVITVSGVTQTLSGNWSFSSGACYVTNGRYLKPNIAAPYYINIPNIGEKSGTSYSTPVVTGCVALLMQSKSTYRVFPELVLSASISSAKKTSDYSETYGFFDEKVGAGIIDLGKMINSTLYKTVLMSGTIPSVDSKSFNVSLTAGQTINIGLSWLAFTSGKPSRSDYYIYNGDYDLLLYDSSGTLVASSQMNRRGNMELIRYKVPKTGTYKIVISCFLKYTDDDEYVALTYNY